MPVINLNLSHIESAESDFPLIPEGQYLAKIIESEILKTKAAQQDGGSDAYLKLKLVIADGPCKGRYIWDYINFRNRSATAQEIGLKRLKAISTILETGDDLHSTDILHGKPIGIDVVTVEEGSFGKTNKIRFYVRKDKIINNILSNEELQKSFQAANNSEEFKDDDLPF